MDGLGCKQLWKNGGHPLLLLGKCKIASNSHLSPVGNFSNAQVLALLD